MKPPSRRRRALLAVPAIAFAMVILFVSSRPGTELPSTGIPQGDKGLHALEYFVLGVLLLLPVQGARWRFRIPVLAAGIMFAGLDEWFQTSVQGRTGDPADFAMDVVGLLVALALSLGVELARAHSPES